MSRPKRDAEFRRVAARLTRIVVEIEAVEQLQRIVGFDEAADPEGVVAQRQIDLGG